jgi:hypothetical protein
VGKTTKPAKKTAKKQPAPKVWTVAEAKARLSEIMRRAETEGPQQIGRRRRPLILSVPSQTPRNLPELPPNKPHHGQWLVENMHVGVDLPSVDRSDAPAPRRLKGHEDQLAQRRRRP